MRFQKLCFLALLSCGFGLMGSTVNATQAPAINAAPLGLELGKATVADVKARIPNAADVGQNKYSKGKQMSASGNGLDVEGLKQVVLVFDKSEVLVAVEMNMNKDAKGTGTILASKYKLVQNDIDSFMNYGYARFEKGDSFIDLNAQHLSFDMTVTYGTKTFMSILAKSRNDDVKSKTEKTSNSM